MTASQCSPLQLRAQQYGADYLISIAGWVLKGQPRSLRKARAGYKHLCVTLLRQIEQAQTTPQK